MRTVSPPKKESRPILEDRAAEVFFGISRSADSVPSRNRLGNSFGASAPWTLQP
jgi:hypothetical protein